MDTRIPNSARDSQIVAKPPLRIAPYPVLWYAITLNGGVTYGAAYAIWL
jgi:hypothetical protein